MTRPWTSLIGLALLLGWVIGLTGCKYTEKPSLLHPGSEQVQQARAVRYDPYPEPNVGPSVDGSRPRNYEKPMPETQRARWQLGDWQ